MSNPFDQFDNATLDSVMPRLIKQESGGRAGVVGPQTPYGRAIGRTQMLPDTAKGVAATLGIPFREDLLSGTTAEAAQYQDMLGRAYLEEGFNSTGSVDGALKYYHGGPNRKLWGPKTEAYASAVGGGAENPFDQFDGAAPVQPPAPVKSAPQAAASTGPAARAPAAGLPSRDPIKKDQGLGFIKGAFTPVDNASRALEAVVRGGAAEQPLAALGGHIRNALPDGLVKFIDDPTAYYQAQRAKGRAPGAIGEFAGNVVGTLPALAVPGGAVAQGAASGALLTDARDIGGVVQDAVVGGIAGKVADKAIGGLKTVASNLLSKAPKLMSPPQLEAAYKAAYKAVDQSGFRFSKANAQQLAGDIEKIVQDRGGKALYPDAWNMAQRAKALAGQKGGLPVTQLDDLRGQIYEYLVQPGGKDASLGKAMREKIDTLVSKEASQNQALREARDLYTRFSKTRTVMNKLEAADLQAGRAYTGKNVNNAIRQKLSPLVDPTSPQKIRNATPDEAAALRRAVVGTPAQNLVRTAGSLLDPRGVIGMGLQATGAAKTAGLSLASVPLGMAATAAGNRLSQQNVQKLLELIAAGGTRQALKKAPTPASQAAVRALTAARPGVPALAVAALPRKKDAK